MTYVIGVVADSHIPDRLAEIPIRALELLAENEVHTILHAGDICHPSAIAQLETVADVIAVRGLTHGHGTPWEYMASKLPFARRRIVPRRRLASLLKHFDTEVQTVVYGHTHLAGIDWIDGVLFFNPGSPAPQYFSDLGPTIGLLRIRENSISPQIVRIG